MVEWEVEKVCEVLKTQGAKDFEERKACEKISEEKWDIELSIGHSLRSLRLTVWADGPLVYGTGEANCLAKAVLK